MPGQAPAERHQWHFASYSPSVVGRHFGYKHAAPLELGDAVGSVAINMPLRWSLGDLVASVAINMPLRWSLGDAVALWL